MYEFTFLIRCYTSEYCIIGNRICNLCITVKSRCIDIPVCICNSGFFCHFRNGQGIISGYNFHFYTLLCKVSKCLRCFFSDWIGKKDISKRRYLAGQCFSVQFSVIRTEYQHTVSFSCIPFNLFFIFIKIISQHEFRCSKYMHFLFVCDTTVFGCGCKWSYRLSLFSCSFFKIFF